MASNAQITLRKKPNRKGEYPLVVRVTKNRRSNYIYTGQYIQLKFWDENNRSVRKSHPDAIYLNNLLSSKLSEANKVLLTLQSDRKDVSSRQIKKEINNALENVTFNDMAANYLKELQRSGKLTRLASDRVRVNHVLTFFGNKDLKFQEIDEFFLRRFMEYLKVERGLSERSVVNNLIVIRTLFNRAIRSGLVDRKLYPFGRGRIQIKFPETEKVGLNISEVRALEGLTDLSKMENHVRNVWLFSFYLAGIRVADLLKIKWSDIYDGRLHYRMGKNAKLVSLQLPEKIYPILKHYRSVQNGKSDYVFPELKKADDTNVKDIYTKTKTATKKFNKYLGILAEKAEIKKKLTMHIARHSFGNIAGDKISVQMLQKLYRHSSITTTMMYQSNFVSKEADKALERVVGF